MKFAPIESVHELLAILQDMAGERFETHDVTAGDLSGQDHIR